MARRKGAARQAADMKFAGEKKALPRNGVGVTPSVIPSQVVDALRYIESLGEAFEVSPDYEVDSSGNFCYEGNSISFPSTWEEQMAYVANLSTAVMVGKQLEARRADQNAQLENLLANLHNTTDRSYTEFSTDKCAASVPSVGRLRTRNGY